VWACTYHCFVFCRFLFLFFFPLFVSFHRRRRRGGGKENDETTKLVSGSVTRS
jgi:hypothetical protein